MRLPSDNLTAQPSIAHHRIVLARGACGLQRAAVDVQGREVCDADELQFAVVVVKALSVDDPVIRNRINRFVVGLVRR